MSFPGKRFFPLTFLGSICWIAAYSYLMVWWANLVGETATIPPEVRFRECSGACEPQVGRSRHTAVVRVGLPWVSQALSIRAGSVDGRRLRAC